MPVTNGIRQFLECSVSFLSPSSEDVVVEFVANERVISRTSVVSSGGGHSDEMRRCEKFVRGGKPVRFPPVCSAVSMVARTHGQVVAGNSLPGFLRQADAPAPPSSVNRENGREGIPCRMRVCSPFLYHIPAFLFFLLLRVAASTTVTR